MVGLAFEEATSWHLSIKVARLDSPTPLYPLWPMEIRLAESSDTIRFEAVCKQRRMFAEISIQDEPQLRLVPYVPGDVDYRCECAAAMKKSAELAYELSAADYGPMRVRGGYYGDSRFYSELVRQTLKVFLGRGEQTDAFDSAWFAGRVQLPAPIMEMRRAVLHKLGAKACGIARRFNSREHLEIAVLVSRDRTGRIAQLAESAPGALLFALALREQANPCSEAGRKLLGDAIAGRRLDRSLDEAIDAWFAQAVARSGDDAGIWSRVATATDDERQRLHHQHRLLIRRASHRVPREEVFLPPPLAFAPEDVPVEPEQNAWWFRTMKSRAFLDVLAPEVEIRRRASRLASRDPRALWNLAERRGVPAIDGLVQGAVIEDHVPIGPTGVRRAIDRLLHTARAALMMDTESYLPTVPARLIPLHKKVPPIPVATISVPDVHLEFLQTCRDIVREGRVMNHCVATRIQTLLDGFTWLAAGTVLGERVTVMVVRSYYNGGFALVEAAARDNKPVTPQSRSEIERWCSGLQPAS